MPVDLCSLPLKMIKIGGYNQSMLCPTIEERETLQDSSMKQLGLPNKIKSNELLFMPMMKTQKQNKLTINSAWKEQVKNFMDMILFMAQNKA